MRANNSPMSTMTKTKTSTKTIVVTAAIVAAAAAAGFGLARPSGPGLTITAERTGEISAVQSREDVTLLSLNLKARLADVTVSTLMFEVIGDDDADLSTIDEDADPQDMFISCTLVDEDGATYAGPEDIDDGILSFIDDFSIAGGDSVNLSIVCDLASDLASADEDIFFARIEHPENVEVEDAEGTALAWRSTHLGRFNRGINMNGRDASLRIVEQGGATVTLSPSSPGGGGFVPSDMEVFRFNITADESGEMYLEELTFNFYATDNEDTDWNTCALSSSDPGLLLDDIRVYNLSTSGASGSIVEDGYLIDSGGSLCVSEEDDLAYVSFFRIGDEDVEVIPAGETYTYAVYVDTSGASTDWDDSIQLGIPSREEMEDLGWESIFMRDASGTSIDASEMDGLPLSGLTITY